MKNILILNRRCIQHPDKGGAEVYTFELAKALIDQGAVVEWFSSKAKNLKNEEKIDGTKFIRRGNQFTTHFYGFFYALQKRDWLIIDEFNGIGFFTFFMKNSILLIHQLYDHFWTAEFGPIGYPLRVVERIMLSFYRKRLTITVSASTHEDLTRLGFKDVTIIYNGLDLIPPNDILEKEENLTLIFLGRLKKTKNPEEAIKAFLLVHRSIPNAKLWIIGDGPLTKPLEKSYGKVEGIDFFGFVSDQEKYDLLRKAHLLLVPSITEGWGQVVIQANAVGTPAIGFKVKGLQDSIQDGKTGFLVRDDRVMAACVIDLWRDRDRYDLLCKNALEWAKHFSWKETRMAFISCIGKEEGIETSRCHSDL